MSLRNFNKQSQIAASSSVVFDWHGMPGVLERLSPPWQSLEVIDRGEGVKEGSRVQLCARNGVFSFRWESLYRNVRPGEGFEEIQVSGPFRRWEHRHRFIGTEAGTSTLRDEIDYEFPANPFSESLLALPVGRKLDALFDHRHLISADDIVAFAKRRESGAAPLKILVTGASGLVGSALLPLLSSQGHQVLRAVRRPLLPGGLGEEVRWRPESAADEISGPERDAFEELDAVIHLAGENIASGRWTPHRKEQLRESRIGVTRRLCELLSSLDSPPRSFLCASAVGYYPTDRDEELDESVSPSDGFLGDLCREWEAACEKLAGGQTRVVNMRIGVVLTPAGGALKKMLTPFRLGLGGRLGNGEQSFSWISIEDLAQAILWLLAQDELSGPVNLTAPSPVSNREFTDTLGAVLNRPTLLPVPAGLLRMIFGEMANDLLLTGARVIPARLIETDFPFRHPDLENALGQLLPHRTT
ncbi:MAG TPA: TIGR01777 family protein [Planctomycetes bacterium]|nr:TIGR01777 family protein [Planctomycetota bacterium]